MNVLWFCLAVDQGLPVKKKVKTHVADNLEVGTCTMMVTDSSATGKYSL